MNTRIITDKKARPVSATISLVVAVCTLGYMVPWAVAAFRGKSNHWGVFWVNLLLGWTLIGWAAAIYLALTGHQVAGYLPKK